MVPVQVTLLGVRIEAGLSIREADPNRILVL